MARYKLLKPLLENLDRIERAIIKTALFEAKNDCKAAAELLGTHEEDFRARMQRLGVADPKSNDDLKTQIATARKRTESELIRSAMIGARANLNAAARALRTSKKGLCLKIKEYEASFPLHLILSSCNLIPKQKRRQAIERRAVFSAMECANGDINLAASLLAVSVSQMQKLVAEYPSPETS